MKRVALTAEKREIGKGVSRRCRVSGKIPAVLYGRTIDPIAITVDRREFTKFAKDEGGTNFLVDLSIKDGDSGLAMIRDYQADCFKREFKHVDFQAITASDSLELEVPIKLVGEPKGAKEGGVIEQLRRTLHIKATPDKIPAYVEVNIETLEIGDSVHADEVGLPEGVAFPHKSNYTIVSIVPPAKIEETTVVATGVEGVEGVEGVAPAAPAAEGAVPAAVEGEGEKKAEDK